MGAHCRVCPRELIRSGRVGAQQLAIYNKLYGGDVALRIRNVCSEQDRISEEESCGVGGRRKTDCGAGIDRNGDRLRVSSLSELIGCSSEDAVCSWGG